MDLQIDCFFLVSPGDIVVEDDNDKALNYLGVDEEDI